MLQDSFFINLIRRIRNTSVLFYMNSRIYILLLNIGFFFRQASESSLSFVLSRKTARLFKDAWQSSLTAAAVSRFYQLINKLSAKDSAAASGRRSEAVKGSIASTAASSLFKTLAGADSRMAGLLLLGFSASGLAIQLVRPKYGRLFTLFEVCLLMLSLLLIALNRRLVSLYEGSWVAQRLSGFFRVEHEK